MRFWGLNAQLIDKSGRLLVFAHEDEAQAFERIPHFVTGIGKVSAAVALARLLAEEPVREVIVLGTAGVLADDVDLSMVYRIRRALQHDLAFEPPAAELGADGRVELQGSVPGRRSRVTAATAAVAPVPTDPVPTAVVATGDSFVTDDLVRSSLAAQGAGLVDMESYAFATVAAGFQVPLRIFKVGSDFADSNTTDETWDDVVARKSAELLDFAHRTRLV